MKDFDSALFVKRLRTIMKVNGVTQQALADTIQVERASVGWWCIGGRLPSAENIFGICKALNVSADYVLGLSGNKYVEEESIERAEMLKGKICDYAEIFVEQIIKAEAEYSKWSIPAGKLMEQVEEI